MVNALPLIGLAGDQREFFHVSVDDDEMLTEDQRAQQAMLSSRVFSAASTRGGLMIRHVYAPSRAEAIRGRLPYENICWRRCLRVMSARREARAATSLATPRRPSSCARRRESMPRTRPCSPRVFAPVRQTSDAAMVQMPCRCSYHQEMVS